MANEAQSDREFDIILWGATGFTGRLVAEYLLLSGGDVRFALAGRNRSKLESIRDGLAELDGRAADIPLLTGDAGDRASLEALAERTKVICTTVGPYAKYGAELVAACVDKRTHYCDLTGEVQFIRHSLEAHHAKAEADGTKIVHCCGFDSIPSDLGVLMMQTEAQSRFDRPLDEIKFFAGESKGGFSGGTIASIMNMIDEVKENPDLRRVMGDPYALNPQGQRSGPDGRDQQGIRFDEDLQMWTAPFIMAAINTRVVRRSNALMDFWYGRDFRYSEVMSTGKGAKGLATATAITGTIAGMMGASVFGPTRALLERTILPAPGEGPSEEAMRAGKFVIRLLGKGRDADGKEVMLRGEVIGRADPGYRGTAIMLGQTALCLAFDGDKTPDRGGVVTPASALGMPLIERLREAGMTWTVHG